MKDKEDLLHKAVGWMLREIGKQDEKSLTSFLDEYKLYLPRTTLRYAIERLSLSQKKNYMKK
jgi:3-methyladenine DNA glycosylase AlkD